MSAADLHNEVRYLISTEEDELWGLTVTGVGCQTISAEQSYPPEGHPQGYRFDVDEGRVLSEYQLLYITDGEGIFTYGEDRESQLITEGKMFFLFPACGILQAVPPTRVEGVLDRFKGAPDRPHRRRGLFPESGAGVQHRAQRAYRRPLYQSRRDRRRGALRLSAGVVGYRDAHARADVLSSPHRESSDENVIGRINKAKVIMREGIYDNLSAKDVADRLHTGYSGFRKAFKEFTGTSPPSTCRS